MGVHHDGAVFADLVTKVAEVGFHLLQTIGRVEVAVETRVVAEEEVVAVPERFAGGEFEGGVAEDGEAQKGHRVGDLGRPASTGFAVGKGALSGDGFDVSDAGGFFFKDALNAVVPAHFVEVFGVEGVFGVVVGVEVDFVRGKGVENVFAAPLTEHASFFTDETEGAPTAVFGEHIGPDFDGIVHAGGFVFFGVKGEDELHVSSF